MSTSSTPSPETLSGPETVAIARTPSGKDRETAGLPASPSRVPRLLQGRQLRCSAVVICAEFTSSVVRQISNRFR